MVLNMPQELYNLQRCKRCAWMKAMQPVPSHQVDNAQHWTENRCLRWYIVNIIQTSGFCLWLVFVDWSFASAERCYMEQLKVRCLLKLSILFVIRVLPRSVFRPCRFFKRRAKLPNAQTNLGNSPEIHGINIESEPWIFHCASSPTDVWHRHGTLLQLIQLKLGSEKHSGK